MNIVNWLADRQRLIELVLVVLVVFSLLLKFLVLPGGDEALMFTMLTLSAFYFLSVFLPGEQNSMMLIPTKVFGIASAICVIGLLFSFLHLPGAKEQLMIGLLSLGVSGVVMLFLVIRLHAPRLIPIIIRLIVLGGLSLSAFMSLNYSAAG